MKKLAILFLLTTLVGASTFAIEGIGDFTAALELAVENATGADDEDAIISAEPSITYSRAFGDFGLAVKLGDVFKYDTDSDADDHIYDELYLAITPSYSLAAGPGTLAFSLTLKPVFYLADYGDNTDPSFIVNPVINYSLDAGFAALAFELGTDDLVIGDGLNEDGDGYGLFINDAYFKASATFPFGLSVWVSPRITIATNDGQGDTEFHEVRVDASYQILEFLSAGVEGRVRVGDPLKEEGIMIKPHAEATFGAIKAWLAVEIDAIANDVDGDITVKPIIGGSYSF
jgi:hypothetical protein